MLDVREPEEFEGELGHIEGSELVPLRFVPERAQGLARRARDEGRAVVVVCRSGRRSAAAVASLGDAGVGALNLTGGMLAWNRESAQ